MVPIPNPKVGSLIGQILPICQGQEEHGRYYQGKTAVKGSHLTLQGLNKGLRKANSKRYFRMYVKNFVFNMTFICFGIGFAIYTFAAQKQLATNTMKHRQLSLAVLFSVLTVVSYSQKLKKADRVIHENLRSHISYLSDDKLEGRRAGSAGEQLAATYISKQFEKAGLQPKGDEGSWLQSFEINDGKQVNPGTLMIVNGHDLKPGTDFFPLCYSPNSSSEAAFSVALRENGVPWVIDIKDSIESNKENPHYDVYEALREMAAQAAEKGATAILVHNSSDLEDKIQFKAKDRSAQTRIPVIYISKNTYDKYFGEDSEIIDMRLRVDIGNKIRNGRNVIGFIDNGAANTVIIGAHYDHLGYGEDGNSMVRTANKQVHNGADDNASGTASIIELAKLLKASKNKSSNYLFIAFSGEELGLFGSKYFIEHPTTDISKANFMINLDMVGRLNSTTNGLTIGGYGTSPAWNGVINSIKDAKNYSIKFDSSGTGPSDHTSFYRKNIPVLFFFTGLHEDYHKPSDDLEKLNTVGTLRITRLVAQVVEKAATKGKLEFTPTREQQTSTSTTFKVTLGVMPDYTYSGQGMKIDGVSSGKAAEKAGLKAGDIIIMIGTNEVSSMETYMLALSKFNKGDKSVVKYKRGDQVLDAPVQF